MYIPRQKETEDTYHTGERKKCDDNVEFLYFKYESVR